MLSFKLEPAREETTKGGESDCIRRGRSTFHGGEDVPIATAFARLLSMPAASISREIHISAMLAERIAAGDFPSAVYLISEKGKTVFVDALGQAVVNPYSIGASLDTIYDLASLTKPLITAMLCAQLIERGELTLDSAVAH